MFNPISFILGWGYKTRRLRKRWDRLREKTLKKDASVRTKLLQREDQVEQNLRILEERRLHRGEKARLAKELEIDLAEIKAMLKAKPEELQAAAAGRAQPMANTEKAKEEQRSF